MADAVVRGLRRLGTAGVRQDMSKRYGITGPSAQTAFGVKMAAMQRVVKQLRTADAPANHALAQALWETGQYEARMVATLVDEPALVTAAQMDRWCRDSDNWAIVDTACFKLFDRVHPSLALSKVDRWCSMSGEFQCRAGLALLACLALHRRDIADTEFVARLPLVERGEADTRHFVKKGAMWARRAIARRIPSAAQRAPGASGPSATRTTRRGRSRKSGARAP